MPGIMRLHFGSRRLWRGIFTISLILRTYFALKWSYIHPDEHLQGPQVVAHGYFNWCSQHPWEFTSEHPIRSFVPLWLVYGVPMSFFPESAEPIHILYGLRILIAVLTWILTDMAVERLSRGKNEKLRALLFVSTSYVTWTYQSRTLSNSFETILVLWFLVIVHEFLHVRHNAFNRHSDCLLLGLIVVLGIFNRPSFAFFLIIPGFSLIKFFWQHKSTFLTFAMGVAASTACFVYIDTLLYSADDWVIAPVNNFLYNYSTSNLQEHGLHWRGTHLLVSLPQLLGPGILLIRPSWTLSMQSAVSALLLFSLVPHQEARFLVPLVPLLCMNMDIAHLGTRTRRVMLGLWLLFNVLAGVLMGMFHQGGVIPAQEYIRHIELPATVIWWETYTPPLWLLGLPADRVVYEEALHGDVTEIIASLTTNDGDNVLRVVDLQGVPWTSVEPVLSAAPAPAYLVAPLAGVNNLTQPGAMKVWQTTEHLTLELFDVNNFRSFVPGLAIWKFDHQLEM